VLSNFVSGLTALGNGPALAFLIGGSIGGMLLGVLPGVGGIVLLSVVLSLINHIDLVGTLCLFLAVQAASYFSASITSILLNTPSHPEAFAVTFDGYPMAQRGEAGRALGISATSTCIGGLIGCACLIGFIQVLHVLPLLFHPPEYVALITIAMLLVGTLGADSASKAIISAALGLLLSTIGASPITGTFRFTLNATSLFGGISLVALALGTFAIPQMVMVFGSASTVARQDMLGNEVASLEAVNLDRGFGKQVVGGIVETFRHWIALVRAALIGVVCGVIPGIGGFAANFLSYGVAASGKNRAKFGTGIAEGIIAPEGSSLAKEAGGMVPVIGLGIPGGVGNALLLAALEIKGIQVGFGFAKQYPVLPYEMTWIIALGGLIGTAAGVLAAPFLARITKVRGPLLVPFVFALSVVGPFVATTSFFAVMEVLVFGFIGLALRRLRYSLASFVIGLVLGPTLEDNIYLTHQVFKGATFLERPLTSILFAVGIAAMVVKTLQYRKAAREKAEAALDPNTAKRARAERGDDNDYPVLALFVTIVLVVFSIAYTYYGASHYDLDTATMPVIVGSIVALGALWRLPFEFRNFIRYRRQRRTPPEPTPVPITASEVHEPASVGVSTGVGTSSRYVSDGAEDASQGNPLPTSGGGASDEPSVGQAGFPPVIERAWGRHGSYTRELVAFAWFGGVILASWLFGFTIGISAFCALYGLTATRRMFPRLLPRVTFAAVAAGTMGFAAYEMLNLLHLSFTPAL
jgi:putative tricarboxylic transport membrane protein